VGGALLRSPYEQLAAFNKVVVARLTEAAIVLTYATGRLGERGGLCCFRAWAGEFPEAAAT
jgi:hypothetical protein